MEKVDLLKVLELVENFNGVKEIYPTEEKYVNYCDLFHNTELQQTLKEIMTTTTSSSAYILGKGILDADGTLAEVCEGVADLKELMNPASMHSNIGPCLDRKLRGDVNLFIRQHEISKKDVFKKLLEKIERVKELLSILSTEKICDTYELQVTCYNGRHGAQ
eukprot:GHVR01192872.1.p1 GENE.GHVR01192872.1~~GHVR01192872.1.p1  ORF type:complete len:162 (-),score=29.68 GHVR01192872.1:179-664(-)